MFTQIISENAQRRQKLVGSHNQLTGEGMEGVRQRVEIADHDLPVQYLTDEVLQTQLYNRVLKAGSIASLVEDIHGQCSESLIHEFRKALNYVRCCHDPAFAFITVFKIKDKISGDMKPFRLNYAQRVLLAEFEQMRSEGKPIRLVLLKARQWGGSTLTQLYMAWIQLFLKQGWNSLIVAQTKDTARRIKAMYSKVLMHFPEFVFNAGHLKFSPSEHSAADYVVTGDKGVPVRNNIITVSSFENYESTRGADVAMAHFSEVAYWITTPGKSAASLIRAVTSGMAEGVPLTLEVMESTANGKSGYFYDEYQEAISGRSARKALFIPFFFIENDMLRFTDYEEEQIFARWLYDNRSNKQTTAKTEESGEFLWSLWLKGATLEHIHWYVERRKSFHSHAQMASEAPSDDVECFTFSGRMMISPYIVAQMEKRFVMVPLWMGDIDDIANEYRLQRDDHGPLRVWEEPDTEKYDDRYMVVVDVGGECDGADYSVMTVVDRINLSDPDNPLFNGWRTTNPHKGMIKVVARWRGHLRYDVMAHKAVALARYYDDAKLVFESNTFDRKKADASQYDGSEDHILGILNTIGESYHNLYMRKSSDGDSVHEGKACRYGYQTNRKTKQYMVDCFRPLFEDGYFNDPDEFLYKELAIYEQRPDGSYGNIVGTNNHDDIVMTDMIACAVSNELPYVMPKNQNSFKRISPYRTINESAF